MSITILNNTSTGLIGASLLVASPARNLYEVMLDVQNFPRWAPGVRRVEVVEGPNGPGMISEWEVSIFGLRRRISSVLEEAESPTHLRWTYDGLVRGWGECTIEDWGGGALAAFRTQIRPTDPALEKFMQTLPIRNVATNHLKRCLARLGQVVSGNGGRVRVGPLKEPV